MVHTFSWRRHEACAQHRLHPACARLTGCSTPMPRQAVSSAFSWSAAVPYAQRRFMRTFNSMMCCVHCGSHGIRSGAKRGRVAKRPQRTPCAESMSHATASSRSGSTAFDIFSIGPSSTAADLSPQTAGN